MSQDLVVLGYITGPHGVRGALKVRSSCDPESAIFNYQPWILRSTRSSSAVVAQDSRSSSAAVAQDPRSSSAAVAQTYTLEGKARALSTASGKMIARVESIEDRDVAQLWQGAEICVPRAQLPTLAPNEYYWADLVGLQVATEQGVDLGVIDHLFATGSNDVMVVLGDKERLLPYIPGQFVKSIDLAQKKMIVDWDPDF